nr:NAC domain-containing protein [Tanacetum cinerariifolium]
MSSYNHFGCKWRGGPFNGGNCLGCSSVGSGNEFVYDPNPYSYNEIPNFFNQPPQHQYETYSCEYCGRIPHPGFDCQKCYTPVKILVMTNLHFILRVSHISLTIMRYVEVHIIIMIVKQGTRPSIKKGTHPSIIRVLVTIKILMITILYFILQISNNSLTVVRSVKGLHYSSDCQTKNQLIYEPTPGNNYDFSYFDQPPQYHIDHYHGACKHPLNGGEVISIILVKEIDEFIKSSVDDLVLIPKESEVTSDSNYECDMPVNTPLPMTNVREEDFDINSPLGEQVVDFLMKNEDVAGLPRHLVKQLFSHLVKNLSSTKRMCNEPLGDDLKLRSYDVTFSNSLFDFNDDFTLCNDNLLFDEEFEDISSLDPPKSTPFNYEPLGNPDSVSRSLETSDLILEELTTNIGLDDSIPTKIDDRYYDSKGDILFLEHLLIEETFSDLTPAVLPKKSTLVTPPPASKQFSLKKVDIFDHFFSLTQSDGEPEGSDDYTEVPFDDEQLLRQHNIAQVTPPAYTPSLPFLATMEPANTLLMGESEVTSDSNYECDMPVNTPLPMTDVREEDFDINSPLGEQVVDFLMKNKDVAGLPRHLVKQLFSHLVKNLSSTKRMSNEPLGDDLKLRSYDVTFSNSLFDFNDDFILCNDNSLFDEEFEDISSLDPPKSTPFNYEPLGNPASVSRSLETSDLILEELTTDIGLDDSIPTKIDDRYYDSKGDILFLEHLLIEETFSDPTPAVLPKKSTLVTPPPASKQFSLKKVDIFDPFFSLTQSDGKTREPNETLVRKVKQLRRDNILISNLEGNLSENPNLLGKQEQDTTSNKTKNQGLRLIGLGAKANGGLRWRF